MAELFRLVNYYNLPRSMYLYNISWLVVWNIFLFFHILGIIIPTDFHIFQRGRYNTNQYLSIYILIFFAAVNLVISTKSWMPFFARGHAVSQDVECIQCGQRCLRLRCAIWRMDSEELTDGLCGKFYRLEDMTTGEFRLKFKNIFNMYALYISVHIYDI